MHALALRGRPVFCCDESVSSTVGSLTVGSRVVLPHCVISLLAARSIHCGHLLPHRAELSTHRQTRLVESVSISDSASTHGSQKKDISSSSSSSSSSSRADGLTKEAHRCPTPRNFYDLELVRKHGPPRFMTCYSDGSVKNDEATIGWVIQAAWATDGLGYPIWHEVAWALAQLGTETVVGCHAPTFAVPLPGLCRASAGPLPGRCRAFAGPLPGFRVQARSQAGPQATIQAGLQARPQAMPQARRASRCPHPPPACPLRLRHRLPHHDH